MQSNLARTSDYQTLKNIEEIKQRNLRVVKKPKRLTVFKLQIANIMLSAVLIMCVVTMVSSYGNLAVLSKEQATLNSELSVVKSVEISLSSRLNNMFNLGYVENYATNQLDMVKVDKSQIEYINMLNNDEIRIEKSKTTATYSFLTQTFYKVMEYMG